MQSQASTAIAIVSQAEVCREVQAPCMVEGAESLTVPLDGSKLHCFPKLPQLMQDMCEMALGSISNTMNIEK